MTSISSKTTKTKVCKLVMFYTAKTAWGQIDPKQHRCVQSVYRTYHHVNFNVYPAVPIKLGEVIKYEAKKLC